MTDTDGQSAMTTVPASQPGAQPVPYTRGTLAADLAAARDRIGVVPKTGWNDYDKYWYHTEDDLVNAVRRVLDGTGIFYAPSLDGDVTYQDYVSGDGKRIVSARAVWIFTFTNGIETIQLRHAGTGDDRSDKGSGKALTDAYKKALSRTFMIPSGDDIEATDAAGSSTQQARPAQQQGHTQRPPQAAAPARSDGRWTWPFGHDKGKTIDEVSTESLQWGLINRFDVSDERWGAENAKIRSGIDAELLRRGIGAQPTLASAAADDGAPY